MTCHWQHVASSTSRRKLFNPIRALSYHTLSQTFKNTCNTELMYVGLVENQGDHKANYRCQVSCWKVHFWCFLWKSESSQRVWWHLMWFTHLKPCRLVRTQSFLYDNKLRWEGLWSLALVSLCEVILFWQSSCFL